MSRLTIEQCFSKIRNGANIKQGEKVGGYPITRIETTANDRFNRDRMGYAGITDITPYESYVLEDGDLLMSHINSVQYLGRTVLYSKQGDEQIIHGMNLLGLRANKDVINPAYARYCFYSPMFKEQLSKIVKKSVNQASFSISDLKKLELEVPSLAEQANVVFMFDKVKSIEEVFARKILLLDQFIKARFVEMFGDPIGNPMGWKTFQLEECLERIDNGKSFVCSDKPRTGSTPAILKLSAATYGDYRPNENKALLDEGLFVEAAEVHKGDLLFTRKNTPELVGMAAYVQDTPPRLMMPDLIFRLVPNDKMNPIFLWQLINFKEFRPVIQAISVGSAKSMSNISKERLGKIVVICPPREAQDKLASFIEQVDKSKLIVLHLFPFPAGLH